jgi:amino acid transporter
MRDPARDVPAAVGRAGVLTVVLYAVPITAILAVLPTDRITSLGGFVDAMRSVFTVYGGHVAPDGTPVLDGAGAVLGGLAAAAFVWVLLTNGLAWVMSAARAQAVACLDGAAPQALGRFSARTGTPVRILLVSGATATATAATAFAIAGDDADRYFSVVLTLSIALLSLANLAVFPSLVRLRRTHPGTPRPFRVPGGPAGAWAAASLATGWCALALVFALVPGLGTPDPDAALPAGFDGQRLAFTASVLLPLAALVAAAALVARRCRPARTAGCEPVPDVRCET